MTFFGYPIETSVTDPLTGEPVVPEDAENLLGEEAGSGCCGGWCCA